MRNARNISVSIPLLELLRLIQIQKIKNTKKIFVQTDGPLEVYADRDRIGQVLSSLLSNALKYSDSGDEIIVKTEKQNGKVICSIKDNGIGIAQDQQTKIFERFYRASGENLHTYPGLGLGLYISKEIIEKHHEKIWVESEEGKGSVFHFSLPINNS